MSKATVAAAVVVILIVVGVGFYVLTNKGLIRELIPSLSKNQVTQQRSTTQSITSVVGSTSSKSTSTITSSTIVSTSSKAKQSITTVSTPKTSRTTTSLTTSRKESLTTSSKVTKSVTSTSQTLKSGGSKVSTINSFKSFLSKYERIGIRYGYMKEASKWANGSLIITQSAGGKINGTDTIKVDLVVINPSGSKSVISIWVSKEEPNEVLKVLANGKTFVGKAAEFYGREVISIIDTFFVMYLRAANTELSIVNGEVKFVKEGWKVVNTKPITVKLGSKEYRGYLVVLKNVGDEDNKAKEVTIKVIKINQNTWIPCLIRSNLRDGSVAVAQITELMLKS